MFSTYSPAAGPPQSQNLNAPPPTPPLGTPPSGVSSMVGSPHGTVLQGLAMLEKGSALIAQVLPGLSPAMVDTVEKLRMTIPRALAEMSAAGVEDGMGIGGPNPVLERPPQPVRPSPLAA